MVKAPIAIGSKYGLSSATGQKLCDVEAFPGTTADAFRFRVNSGYLRILQDGSVDLKGGGGGLCNFSVDVHESGLLSLVRGPFQLATDEASNGNSFSAAPKGQDPSAQTLWSLEEKESMPPAIVYLQQGSCHYGPFVRVDREDDVVLFQTSEGGYLRIAPATGAVDIKGGGGAPCQFTVRQDAVGTRLQSVADASRFLGVNAWGALTGLEVEAASQCFTFNTGSMDDIGLPSKIVGHAEFNEEVDLPAEEREAFVRDGFIIVRGAVSRELVEAALGNINAALLKPGSVTKDDDGTLQICQESRRHESVQALLYATPLWTIAQRLLGRGKVSHCPQSQMALRPPNLGAKPLDDEAIPPKQWHIDGMNKGNHSPFSILLGIALSEQTLPNCGNLVAFPGSHHVLHPLIRGEVESGSGIFSDEAAERKPALHGGKQIYLKPGDAVLLHQKVAHRVGVNLSPHIRYQTYFRLSHVDHAKKLTDGSLLDDLWTEFEGLQDDVAKFGDADDVAARSAKLRRMDVDQ